MEVNSDVPGRMNRPAVALEGKEEEKSVIEEGEEDLQISRVG